MSAWKQDSIVGSLTKRITFQGKGQEYDVRTGELRDRWEDVKTVWASIMPVSIRDFVEGKAMQSEVTHKITVRSGYGITPDMRIVFKERKFEIVGVMNITEDSHKYVIMAKELYEDV